MFRRQIDSDGDPEDLTGIIISLLVLFLIILTFFLVLATNYLRSQAEARSAEDIAATEAALASGLATFTPDFGNVLLLSTETETPFPTETETPFPTETETAMPTETDTAVPFEVDTSTPTPETIIPVTGADLQAEQAAAVRQWIQIGGGILAMSLFVVGMLFRQKHK